MTQERLTMRKIREILRLKHEVKRAYPIERLQEPARSPITPLENIYVERKQQGLAGRCRKSVKMS